jgi:hypothetical protein
MKIYQRTLSSANTQIFGRKRVQRYNYFLNQQTKYKIFLGKANKKMEP